LSLNKMRLNCPIGIIGGQCPNFEIANVEQVYIVLIRIADIGGN